jgi:16S rRNA (cytosine967-C5)-methyltransferase
MSLPRPATARSIAAEVLSEVQLRGRFADEVLSRYLQLTEKQKATDLVFGVIRNRNAIDLIIQQFASGLIVQVPEKILNVLRVGVYEFAYCPQAAEYAIVDEAVGYAKRITNAKQAGFVNAVLRQTLRNISSRQKILDQASPLGTLPQTPNTGCEFNIELFPDKDASPEEYLSTVFSLPRWLVDNWVYEYGKDETRGICFASNRRPSVYLRPNTLRATAAELTEKLKAAEVECEIEPETQMIKLTAPKAITSLPGFDDGLFVVQDLAASQVVWSLNPKPDWRILDLCAAPGTKTTQLAEATGGKAKITATDIDTGRLDMVKENIARLGLADCVTVIEYNDLDECVEQVGGFDCVLVDAPCSNTGVLARRPEVRHRITVNDIKKLAETQMSLLSKAAAMLKPKGIICYSTCSIQSREDGLLVREFIKENPSFKIESENLILPSADKFDRDGSYSVVIIRKSTD